MRLQFGDAIRVCAFLGTPFALSFGLPLVDGPSSTSSIFNSLLLFSFLLGFFLNRSLERRRQIVNSIEIELARLRRIWNITHAMTDVSLRDKLTPFLQTYHEKVAKDLLAYKDTLDAYRDVSLTVYGYEPTVRRDEMLWSDLLSTTRDLALERRPLERALETNLAGRAWAAVGFMAFSAIGLLLVNRGQPGLTRFSVGLTIAGILAALDLLHRLDRLSPKFIGHLQDLYRQNVPRG